MVEVIDMKGSPRFELNTIDIKRIAKNAAIFFAPAILLFAIELQAGKPMSEAVIVLQLWGFNTLIDLIRKFIAENSTKK